MGRASNTCNPKQMVQNSHWGPIDLHAISISVSFIEGPSWGHHLEVHGITITGNHR